MLDGNLGMVYLTIINVLKISNHMNNEASVAGSLEVGGEEAEHGGGGGGGGGPHLLAADVPAHHLQYSTVHYSTIQYSTQPCSMSRYSRYTHSGPWLITLHNAHE